MARIVDKLKRYFADRNVKDIAPPDAAIPHGLAPDLRPTGLRHRASSKPATTKRSVDRASGSGGRSLGASDERTEELLSLSLTDEVTSDSEDNGFDPYNTGAFRSTGSWTRDPR